MSDVQIGAEASNFILQPELAGKVWQILSAIRIAPASEKLAVWKHTAQLIAGLTGPDFPLGEAAARMWATAETDKVLRNYDADLLEAKLAGGFSDPIFPDETADSVEDGARPPAFTDEALALCFAEQHVHDLRYVAAWSKWLVWDGKRWGFDETLVRLISRANSVVRRPQSAIRPKSPRCSPARRQCPRSNA